MDIGDSVVFKEDCDLFFDLSSFDNFRRHHRSFIVISPDGHQAVDYDFGHFVDFQMRLSGAFPNVDWAFGLIRAGDGMVTVRQQDYRFTWLGVYEADATGKSRLLIAKDSTRATSGQF